MPAKLRQSALPMSEAELKRAAHALMVLPETADLAKLQEVPGLDALAAALKRRGKKPQDLAKTPLGTDLPNGTFVAWVMLDPKQSLFEQQSAMRKGLQILLAEKPTTIAVGVFGRDDERRRAAELAVYAAWVNGEPLPQRRKKPDTKPLRGIELFGYRAEDGFAVLRAQAAGNNLCRELTALPPNELTPGTYRERVRVLARMHGWQRREYDLERLRRMGAGAFVAVAQGSAEEDAAIVHLAYRHGKAKKTFALVGKGICFDTGGHNLKTARHMHGMHEDMNGSAVALGVLLAATEARLPVNLDCWLAIAQNQLSPKAYKQNEVVTALNGTTIEVVHTDAEGRMVLADALTLAARARPDLIVDFATLTGSMHVALGTRYSGVFATSEELARDALAAGADSGERVCLFPMDEDYETALESSIADVKQCAMESEADHILAARFLKRFTQDLPWIHVDLSASNCKGGLGAVATDITGFGVGWGVSLLKRLARS
jgi:leucyl aminopeptidase